MTFWGDWRRKIKILGRSEGGRTRVRIYHSFGKYKQSAQEHGVVASKLCKTDPVVAKQNANWNREQPRAKNVLMEDVERALIVHNATNEEESGFDNCIFDNKFNCCLL